MPRIAFVFPGQGTQHVGMGKSLIAEHASARDVFDRASNILGVDMRNLCLNASQEILDLTANTQIAVLTFSIALYEVFREKFAVQPIALAGHSLGEYTALYAAGALSFNDVFSLVQARALYHQEACAPGEGAMAAIIGLNDAVVEEICSSISSDEGRVSLAIYNSPEQVVVSGHTAAIEQVLAATRQKGALKAVRLQISAPCHCGLLQSAADKLAERLKQIEIRDFTVPVIPNSNPAILYNKENARSLLINQIIMPVQWRQTVDKMTAMGVEAIVEIGPKKTLCGLIKRINRNIQLFCVEDAASLQKTVEMLTAEKK